MVIFHSYVSLPEGMCMRVSGKNCHVNYHIPLPQEPNDIQQHLHPAMPPRVRSPSAKKPPPSIAPAPLTFVDRGFGEYLQHPDISSDWSTTYFNISDTDEKPSPRSCQMGPGQSE